MGERRRSNDMMDGGGKREEEFIRCAEHMYRRLVPVDL